MHDNERCSDQLLDKHVCTIIFGQIPYPVPYETVWTQHCKFIILKHGQLSWLNNNLVLQKNIFYLDMS